MIGEKILYQKTPLQNSPSKGGKEVEAGGELQKKETPVKISKTDSAISLETVSSSSSSDGDWEKVNVPEK